LKERNRSQYGKFSHCGAEEYFRYVYLLPEEYTLPNSKPPNFLENFLLPQPDYLHKKFRKNPSK
jgi:hypothetical protein